SLDLELPALHESGEVAEPELPVAARRAEAFDLARIRPALDGRFPDPEKLRHLARREHIRLRHRGTCECAFPYAACVSSMNDLSGSDVGGRGRVHGRTAACDTRRMDAVRGRFAPSPTGELHLGNARTALLAWLWAKGAGGGFTLRMEDLDRPRERPGIARQQLVELAWLGIDWDEGPDPRTGLDEGPRGPYRQSQRTELYEDALRALGDRVYECFCS